jgi:transcriptional regulator with XRE-family HTH domain
MVLTGLAKIVRDERSAQGMTQGQLAQLADLSRATIVDLEAGRVRELGISKLERLLAILGLALSVSSGQGSRPGKQTDPVKLAARTASTSFRRVLTPAQLEESLATGVIPNDYRAHLSTLINETPAPLLARTVKRVAQHRMVEPKMIWRNLARWSQLLQTTRTL